MTMHRIERVRHEGARRRSLTVAAKTTLAPKYLSITFSCDDFEDFVTLGADDHVKLFIPDLPSPEGGKPAMRDYTPRAFDVATGKIVIDFALHDDPGPATAWALSAQVGDRIEIGGPRGSAIVPSNLDWYWLIGDEAALPAIARRLEELPRTTVHVLAAVQGPGEEIALPLTADHIGEWVHRSNEAGADPRPLLERVRQWQLPPGVGFVWIAAEAGVAKVLREAVAAMGHPAAMTKAAGYWTKGLADTTARLD